MNMGKLNTNKPENKTTCGCEANSCSSTNRCDCDVIHTDTVEKVKTKMLSDETLMDISDFYKAFSDSTRLKIINALNICEMCVCDISVLLNMTKSAVSHQLKVLRTAKLVRAEKKGKNVYYALDDNHVKMILEKALEHVCE